MKTGIIAIASSIVIALPLTTLAVVPVAAAYSPKAAAPKPAPLAPSKPYVPNTGLGNRSIQTKQENCQIQCPYTAPTSGGALGAAQNTQQRNACMSQCLASP